MDLEGDINIQSVTEDLGKPGGYQKLISEWSKATGGICLGSDLSLSCHAPALFIASCSWESSIHALFRLSWSKNFHMFTHRCWDLHTGMGHLDIQGDSPTSHQATMPVSVSGGFKTMLGYLCEGFHVRYASGWPLCLSIPCYNSYASRSQRAPEMSPPSHSSSLLSRISHSHGCFQLFAVVHVLPSPGAFSSGLGAHPEASSPTSFLDSPHFAKLLGAVLNVQLVDEFQGVCELFSCVVSHIRALWGLFSLLKVPLLLHSRPPALPEHTHVTLGTLFPELCRY